MSDALALEDGQASPAAHSRIEKGGGGSARSGSARRRQGSPRGGKGSNRMGRVDSKVASDWILPTRPQLRALVQGRIFQSEDFKYGDCIGKGSMAAVRLVVLRKNDDGLPIPMVMKVMSKSHVIRLNQAERVKQEKRLMETFDSPYVVALLSSFQDERRLCLLLEFVHGGDLFGRLKEEGRLPVDHSKFYAVELTLALQYLQTRSVAYRDLKPENVLIDKGGHVKLCDFGFAKQMDEAQVAYSVVGTPEYVAPEMILASGHNASCDYWALGILIFEMLAGYPPFIDDSPYGIYRKVIEREIPYPRHFDVKAMNLLNEGLLVDKDKRFGAAATMRHRWFEFVDWEDVLGFAVTPPFQPTVASALDTGRFAIVPDDEAQDRFKECLPIMKKENQTFLGVF